MKLTEIFPDHLVIRDNDVFFGSSPNFDLPRGICYAVDVRRLEIANANPHITAVICKKELMEKVKPEKGLVKSECPQKDYYIAHNLLTKGNETYLIDQPFIHETARISSSAHVAKNVVIHENVKIDHGAAIYDNTIIGKNTRIGPYAVIGTSGLQNNYVAGEVIELVFQGGVNIGEHCEVLAHTIIQKPYQAFFTSIGKNTKISVACIIAHGCRIGENTMIAGKSHIAGNCRVGDYVWIGPSATISDNIEIGDSARINICSVVVKNVKAEQSVSGNFAIDHRTNLQWFAKKRRNLITG